MMGAPRFRPLSTEPIIVQNVKRVIMKKMLKMIPAEEPRGITLDYAQVQKNPG